MFKHREFLMNELANSLDESFFAAAGPAAVTLTTLHDVRAGQAPAAHDALVAMQAEQPPPRATAPHLLHCGMMRGDTRLLFTAVIDAPGRQHLAELLIDYNEVLEPLWRRCESYPEQGIDDVAGIVQFLSAGCEPTQLIYSGSSGATVKEVRKALDWMRKTMHFQIELAKSPRNGAGWA